MPGHTSFCTRECGLYHDQSLRSRLLVCFTYHTNESMRSYYVPVFALEIVGCITYQSLRSRLWVVLHTRFCARDCGLYYLPVFALEIVGCITYQSLRSRLWVCITNQSLRSRLWDVLRTSLCARDCGLL